MKRITAILLCLAVIFSFSVIPVSAEKNKPRIIVRFERNYIFESVVSEDGKELASISETPVLPVIGQKCYVDITLKGFDSLSSGKMTVRYNDETIDFKGDKEPLDGYYDEYDNRHTYERAHLKADLTKKDSGFSEFEIAADGRAFIHEVLCDLIFEATALGSFDFDITFSDFRDKDGNNIDFNVEMPDIPLYTHTADEIPDIPVLDQEICLTYDMGLTKDYVKTELAYPMSVGDFIDSVECGDGNGVIVDSDGKMLDREAPVPTGAKFRQCYDNAILFETTLTVIGDVTCDGKITAADARKILRIAANLENVYNDDTGTAITIAANPAQGEKAIQAKDARAVLRYAAGLEDSYSEWYRYHCLLNKYSHGLYNENI